MEAIMAVEAKLFLDEAATARLLKVSQRTLQRWRGDGTGPAFIRAGAKRILYDAAAIERWTAKRTFPHRAAELAQTLS
jgi:predicted DNA-binding transcriptional regulator AlpA